MDASQLPLNQIDATASNVQNLRYVILHAVSFCWERTILAYTNEDKTSNQLSEV